MDAEALFLESRREREENRTQRHLRSQNIQEKRQRALEMLKTRLKEWTCELEQITSNACAETEEDKRNLRIHFAKHDDKLKHLRKECLSTDSLSSLLQILGQSSTSDGNSSDDDEFVTVSDFGVFHAQFSECQARLDRCRKEKLPRGKFLFRRYRQALESYDKPLQESEMPVNNPGRASVNARLKRLDPQRTLSDLQDLNRIVVHSDGSVEGTEIQKLASSPASLVLHNIKRCTIELRGFYQSIHLTSVLDSSILIVNSIDGAIHVTDCHNCTLRSTCQQVRLHGSTGLECHVLFKGGAILEDCSRISFWKARDIPVGDIRDFNWLKNGIPSPNFSVEEECQASEEAEITAEVKEELSRNQAGASLREDDNKTLTCLQHAIDSISDDQEDEDEL